MGKYRTQFVQGVATMLTAGLPLIESLEAYKMEVRAKSMKKVIDKVLTSVNGGVPLWRAMDTTHFFSSYEIALVRIGEEAGNLARNMEYLAEQQEKDRSLKAKVKMAMIYPSIVLTLMFVIVMGLGIFVLPNLVQVLYSLNADLPLTTRIVIKVTQFFEKHGMVVAPLSIVGIILFALLAKFTRFRGPAQKILFMIPGIGSLAYDATIARFGVILGGLLRAGVPLVQALESLVEVTTVVSYKRMYQTMLTRITVGDSFSKCFAEIRSTKKLLPPSVQQLIVTGERSGTLSETLMKIATIYEKKAEETAEKLPTILEPMLLLIIGGLVGTIAFAIITPIYSVVGNLN
jgi:type IV pilus assembly protein PilC